MNIHNRIQIDNYFMEIAKLVAKRSTCLRLQVGSVLTNENKKIISTGYNGVVQGEKHCINYFSDKFNNMPVKPTKTFVEYVQTEEFKNEHALFSRFHEIHSEQNSLIGIDKNSTKNAILYTTVAPCIECAKICIISKIKKVIYLVHYDRPESDGLPMLSQHSIENYQIS